VHSEICQFFKQRESTTLLHRVRKAGTHRGTDIVRPVVVVGYISILHLISINQFGVEDPYCTSELFSETCITTFLIAQPYTCLLRLLGNSHGISVIEQIFLLPNILTKSIEVLYIDL